MMPDKIETPIEEVTASLGGIRVKDGVPNYIEFKVAIVLSARSVGFLEYLASCLSTGADVTIRRNIETLEEHAARDPDTEPAEGPSNLFPGWPQACGKAVETYGMNTRCEAGHIGTTPRGEPCAWMPPTAPEVLKFDEGGDGDD